MAEMESQVNINTEWGIFKTKVNRSGSGGDADEVRDGGSE